MKGPESHADSAVPGVVVNAVPGRKGGCVSSSNAAGDEALGDVAAGEVEMAEGAAELAGGVKARDCFPHTSMMRLSASCTGPPWVLDSVAHTGAP